MRYLKIKSLKPVKSYWVYSDDLMLHACFQILKDFVENKEFYEQNRPKSDFVKDVMFLYNWWEIRKDKDRDTDKIDEDNEMLDKLMILRSELWYTHPSLRKLQLKRKTIKL